MEITPLHSSTVHAPPSKKGKYLVTGATGFIGRHLVEALVAEVGVHSIVAMTHTHCSHDERAVLQRWRSTGVSVIEYNLLDSQLSSCPLPAFDVVYHLAGHTETESPPAEFRVNSEGTRNLVRWLGPALHGKRLVYASTLAVVDRPMFGCAIDESTICRARTAYGRTKLAGEDFIRSFQGEFGFDYTILRLCTIVGTGYRPTGMFGVFPRMLARNAYATRLNWPGRVSLMGVADLVRIFLTISDCPRARNELFVMSNGENPSVDQVLDGIATVLGYERDKVSLPRWLWRAVGPLCRSAARFPALPHRVRTFLWRASHMIYDGVCADSSKLEAVLAPSCEPFIQCLRGAYGRPRPAQVGASAARSAINRGIPL